MTVEPPYSSCAVANRLIHLSLKDGWPVSHLQAQKLTFISNGRYLCDYGRPLINEFSKAWTHGPVYPSLFNRLHGFGSKPMDSPLYSAHEKNDFTIFKIPDHDTRSLDLIERVWENFGHIDGFNFSHLLHAPSSPWRIVRTQNGIPDGEPCDLEIPLPLIAKYFRNNFKFRSRTDP